VKRRNGIWKLSGSCFTVDQLRRFGLGIGATPNDGLTAPVANAVARAAESIATAGLDLRHLRYFIAVAEELHFGRAARRLHMSQPPLSQHIRFMERQLGVLLLYRDSHSVRLTAAGSALLAEAPKLLAAVERLTSVIRSLGNEVAGQLRIGFNGPMASAINSRILHVIASRYPRVVPELEELGSPDQVRAIREGDLELGLLWETSDARIPDPELDSMCVYEGPVSLAVERDNPLAASSVVTFAQLAKERLVLFKRHNHPEMYDAIISALRQHGIKVSTLFVEGSGIADMVASGVGVALLPSGIELAGIVIRPLSEVLLTVRTVLVWLRDNPLPALQRYVEVARELKESGELAFAD
jgi:DNA-binding transcriptional LysR family regulator